jgi:ribosomal protein S18 acetylase RimI-like enzyme
MTVRIRSFRESDATALFGLLQMPSSDEKLLYMHYFEGNLLHWVRERKIEVLMAEDETGIVGSAAYHDSFWGEEIEWLALSETANRRLVEDMLIREVEKYVKGSAVFIAVSVGSQRAEEWLRRGYSPDGGLIYMVAKLAGLNVVPKIPDGALLRSLKPEEENDFVQLVNAGFGRERVKVSDVQRWKAESPPFDEEWIHVAEIDGKLVSVVVGKPDTGYNRFFNAKRGYLGPAATLPEHRGKNLASALTVRAMNSMFSYGMDSVCLFTAEMNSASRKLLGKIGFQVGHDWKFMTKHF